MPKPFHIVVCKSGLHLVRAPDAHWRDLQDRFSDFMTSLGPCDIEAALDLILQEWPDLAGREAAVRAFADDETRATFELAASR